jgi:hypothetical protein
MAQRSLATSKDTTTAHQLLLAQSREVWRVVQLDLVYLLYFIELLQGNALSCGHGFCNYCVVLHTRQTEPWQYSFTSGPLCKFPNSRPTRIKPYTLGIRSINIDSSSGDIDVLSCFLKELQSTLSIYCKSLQEHFDFDSRCA